MWAEMIRESTFGKLFIRPSTFGRYIRAAEGALSFAGSWHGCSGP